MKQLQRIAVVTILLIFYGTSSVNAGTATPDNFFVFVGEKISLTYVPPKEGEIPFDRQFTATYKVDTSIYGNYSGDTIEFAVYIHRGDSPAFSIYENVLLYLTKYEGKWYHEKYQFNAVYRTKNGRWAGDGRADDYGHSFNSQTKLYPQRIDFQDSVCIDLKPYPQWKEFYQNEYYVVKGDRAYPIAGNYIEDLFALKKTGVLKARDLF